MENKNLPEIGFQKKKEKKGFLPWLRQRLGLGGGSSLGSASGAANMVNLGRGLGTANSAGILGLLAGKAGLIATMAIMAAVIGTTVYIKNSSSPSDMAAASIGDASKATGTQYIPAIMRNQDSNASSLDMFKEANKGEMSMEEQQPKEQPKQEEAKPADEAAQPGNPGDMAGQMAAKLQGAGATGLSGDLNGGSGKMAMGGFNNKVGQGAFGTKVGFSNIGANFSNLPKFSDRRNKLLAMGSSKKALGNSNASRRGSYGRNALSQAKGVKEVQKQYTSANIEGLRGTQDKAWEGQTSGGDTTGGGGLSDGSGEGIVTSPSLDNSKGGGYQPVDNTNGLPGDTGHTTANPWGDLLSECMMLLIGSAALAFAGGKLFRYGKSLLSGGPWTVALGIALMVAGIAMVIAAVLMALKVLMNGIAMMTKFKQSLMGTIYIIGGLVGMIGAVMSLFEGSGGITSTMTNWTLGAAAMIGLLGSMASSMGTAKDYSKDDKAQEYSDCKSKNSGFFDYCL